MRTFLQKPKATQQATPANSTIPSRVHLGQSRAVNSILNLQRTIGNQAVQRLLEKNKEGVKGDSTPTEMARFGHESSRIPVYATVPLRIQPKLTVNAPGDIYEQEAERVAEQVLRMPEPRLQRTCVCGGGCPKCQTEQPGYEHEHLQTKRFQASATGQIATPPIIQEVLAAPGQPLDPAARGFMERRFGYDFGQVRVHANTQAAESARAVNALAYTVGRNLVFGAGQYRPNTSVGQRLLAHELVHIVQQGASTTTLPQGVCSAIRMRIALTQISGPTSGPPTASPRARLTRQSHQ
jgi:hypothetical protein